MRDTTKIKAIAQETIADLQGVLDSGKVPSPTTIEAAIANQKEIANIATRMDARTGTSDPSVKKAGS